jgi:hypothetical protein
LEVEGADLVIAVEDLAGEEQTRGADHQVSSATLNAALTSGFADLTTLIDGLELTGLRK